MLKSRQNILIAGDVFIFITALLLTMLIRYDISTQFTFIIQQGRLFLFLFLVWLLVFFIFDLYNLRRVNPNPRNIGLLIVAMIVNAIVSISFFYLFSIPGITPKTNLLLLVIISICLLILWRRWFYTLFTRTFRRRIGLIGNSTLLHTLADEIRSHPHIGEVAYIDNEHQSSSKNIHIFIAESVLPETLLQLSRNENAEVFSLYEAYKNIFAKLPVTLLTNEKAVEIIAAHSSTGIELIKRAVEIFIACFILILSSPLLLIAAIAIFIEDGKPVILKQKRIGRHGKPFFLYKFRSMKALAPDGSAEVAGVQWAAEKDARITKVGNILRKSHLDEIPQMFNILKGDISLIGPRPERPELVEMLEKQIPYYFLRHTIKPGFTGWAQIKFRYARSVLDSQEKFEYDLYYLSNKNILLDIGIFLKTIQIIFTH